MLVDGPLGAPGVEEDGPLLLLVPGVGALLDVEVPLLVLALRSEVDAGHDPAVRAVAQMDDLRRRLHDHAAEGRLRDELRALRVGDDAVHRVLAPALLVVARLEAPLLALRRVGDVLYALLLQ